MADAPVIPEDKELEVLASDLPAAKVAEISLMAKCISTAIATGFSTGIREVLASPEMGRLLEGITQGNAVSGVLQGLAAAEGRKSLDARVLKQNGLEISYAIRNALDSLKQMQTDQASAEPRNENVVDPEQQYLDWKKRREQGDEC